VSKIFYKKLAACADGPAYMHIDRLTSILGRCLSERSGASLEKNGDYTVRFNMSCPETKVVYKDSSVDIYSPDLPGLIYGLGAFLHSAELSEEGICPSGKDELISFDSPFRALYFPLHFYNFYHNAPIRQIELYLEDLMLWGFDSVFLNFPRAILDSWEDPDADDLLERFESILSISAKLGLKTGFLTSNHDFRKPKKEFEADKTHLNSKTGNLICPSTEEGYLYYEDIVMKIVHAAKKIRLDYLLFWSYNEGGCSCERCAPWGGRGYYNSSKRIARKVSSVYPDTKFILSTWTFGSGINDPRDWETFYRRVEDDIMIGDRWISYIVSGNDKYPAEHGLPGGIPMIGFPDISLNGLNPWGGFGATPVPARLEGYWQRNKKLLSGAILYSEGIFEDISKAVLAGFFRNTNAKADDTVASYVRYEYGASHISDIKEIIRIIEHNHMRTLMLSKKPADMELAHKAYMLSKEISEKLPQKISESWRWRILAIRAFLDVKRYSAAEAAGWPYKRYTFSSRRYFWGDFLTGDEEAEPALRELIKIYHAIEDDHGEHFMHLAVRPPLKIY